MPRRMKIKKVILSFKGKKGTEHKFESNPLNDLRQSVHVDSKSTVELKRTIDSTQDEKINLLQNQVKGLCKRFENVWYRRAWRFLNKPIGVLPWQ